MVNVTSLKHNFEVLPLLGNVNVWVYTRELKFVAHERNWLRMATTKSVISES